MMVDRLRTTFNNLPKRKIVERITEKMNIRKIYKRKFLEKSLKDKFKKSYLKKEKKDLP
jgi:hypothetical protein